MEVDHAGREVLPGARSDQAKQLCGRKSEGHQHLATRPGELDLQARIASYELAARMQLAVPEVLDLRGESDATKKLYGFGDAKTEP